MKQLSLFYSSPAIRFQAPNVANTSPAEPTLEPGIKKEDLVLSSGAFVGRDIPGQFLIQRIDEWHRRHPNQLAAATMIHTISRHKLNLHTTTCKAPSTATSSAYQLTPAEQIASLQAQRYNLHNRPTTSTRP
jgi:hypothetical protein